MRFIPLILSISAAQVFAINALASDEPEPAPPHVRSTPSEKEAGKALRKQTGSEASTTRVPEETRVVTPARSGLSQEERQAERAKRKAEVSRANKAGEIPPRGDTGN
jgi:hypothetical protein